MALGCITQKYLSIFENLSTNINSFFPQLTNTFQHTSFNVLNFQGSQDNQQLTRAPIQAAKNSAKTTPYSKSKCSTFPSQTCIQYPKVETEPKDVTASKVSNCFDSSKVDVETLTAQINSNQSETDSDSNSLPKFEAEDKNLTQINSTSTDVVIEGTDIYVADNPTQIAISEQRSKCSKSAANTFSTEYYYEELFTISASSVLQESCEDEHSPSQNETKMELTIESSALDPSNTIKKTEEIEITAETESTCLSSQAKVEDTRNGIQSAEGANKELTIFEEALQEKSPGGKNAISSNKPKLDLPKMEPNEVNTEVVPLHKVDKSALIANKKHTHKNPPCNTRREIWAFLVSANFCARNDPSRQHERGAMPNHVGSER